MDHACSSITISFHGAATRTLYETVYRAYVERFIEAMRHIFRVDFDFAVEVYVHSEISALSLIVLRIVWHDAITGEKQSSDASFDEQYIRKGDDGLYEMLSGMTDNLALYGFLKGFARVSKGGKSTTPR